MKLKTAYWNFQPKNTKNSEIITGISNRAQNSIQSTHYWYSAISFDQQVKRTYVTKIFCNDCKYIKIIFVHCSWRNEYRSHPRSYEHYCISSWNKAWKKSVFSGQFKKFNSTTSSVVCITAKIASVFKNGVVTAIVNSYHKYWWRCVHVSVIFKIKPDCWMLYLELHYVEHLTIDDCI